MIKIATKMFITDKFLQDIYVFISGAESVGDFIFSNRYKKTNILLNNENPIVKKYQKEVGIRKFSKLINYLKRNNYIKAEGLKGRKAVLLTKKGVSKALKASFKLEGQGKRKDGKWIMLIFDIPEKYKKSRNLLTSALKNLGYKIFQQSVWISPCDIYDKTRAAMQFYSLEKFVKIFLIEEI